MALTRPTGRVRYVDTAAAGGANSGTGTAGDPYGCLNYALAQEKAAVTDLTTTTDGLLVICKATGGAADTTFVQYVNTQFTTDATHPLWVEVDSGSRHAGVYSTSKYRIEVGEVTAGLYVRAQYAHFEGLLVQVTSTSSTARQAITVADQVAGGSEIEFEACISRGVIAANTSTTHCCGFFVSDTDAVVTARNCLAYDWKHNTSYGAGFRVNNGNLTCVNCTAVDSQYGFLRSIGTASATNCGAAECATGFSGTGFATPTTSSSSTPTFVDAANDDFHLASTDTTWKDQGTEQAFDTDIDGALTGTTRNDIGAHEYESGGEEPPAATVSMLCLLGVG